MKPATGTHTIGMVGNGAPRTSLMAAKSVNRRKPTLRQRVEDFARRCPFGFTDEEVRLIDPDAPESSLRKRRTELSAENIILASEQTRKNRAGMPCTVFFHRDHVNNPPPIKPRAKKPSRFALLQEENATLRANNAQLCAEIERLNGIIAKTGFGF